MTDIAEGIRDFRDLIVWRKSIALAKGVYLLTGHFPSSERLGLTDQLRRASVSISSNIAEGHARSGRAYSSFLSIARGSAAEVQSQLILAVELGFATEAYTRCLLDGCTEIKRMIAAIVSKLAKP